MGHVGLTPQTATQLGGYKAQGKTAERAAQIADEALALQEAGCFAIVFEAVPAAFTEAIMGRMEIPVIGIGAGHDTDGQVLVFHDLLGIFGGHAAKFVKRYANVREEMVSGSPSTRPRCARAPSRAPSTSTRSSRPSCPSSAPISASKRDSEETRHVQPLRLGLGPDRTPICRDFSGNRRPRRG